MGAGSTPVTSVGRGVSLDRVCFCERNSSPRGQPSLQLGIGKLTRPRKIFYTVTVFAGSWSDAGQRRIPVPPRPPTPVAIGSIRLGSLFLTLPTRSLTDQHVIPSEG